MHTAYLLLFTCALFTCDFSITNIDVEADERASYGLVPSTAFGYPTSYLWEGYYSCIYYCILLVIEVP